MIGPSRRIAVVAALREAGVSGLSGETLADALGISRVAVNKHVAALRELGFEIGSTPHIGYRLIAEPDRCIPETVAPRLRDPLWVACEGGLELGSTNTEAKRLAAAGAAEGTVVLAARQTAGRGRFGRVWESPAGGVYASFVLRPPLAPATVGTLSLAVAVGAARALADLGAPVGLKWPNDVEADGRKLAGILLEMSAEAERVEWVVVGCGVNVRDAGSPEWTALGEHVPGAAVADVAAALLDAIAGAYRQYLHAGFSALHAEYESRMTLLGREVVARDALGREVAAGTVEGVSEHGELVVRSALGMVHLAAGEVTLRR